MPTDAEPAPTENVHELRPRSDLGTAQSSVAGRAPTDGSSGRAGPAPPEGGPPDMTGYATKTDLNDAITSSENRITARLGSLHAAVRNDMIVQTLATIGILLAVYFGVVASNQAAGTLGFSISQTAQQSADMAAERAAERVAQRIVTELSKAEEDAQRERSDRR